MERGEATHSFDAQRTPTNWRQGTKSSVQSPALVSMMAW